MNLNDPKNRLKPPEILSIWFMNALKGKQDYDVWISDGIVIGKILQSVMFNSIPVDMVEKTSAVQKNDKKSKNNSITSLEKAAIEDRIKTLLKYLKKYGVPEQYLFKIDDLTEMTNIPKVTRCIAMLGKMVSLKILRSQLPY